MLSLSGLKSVLVRLSMTVDSLLALEESHELDHLLHLSLELARLDVAEDRLEAETVEASSVAGNPGASALASLRRKQRRASRVQSHQLSKYLSSISGSGAGTLQRLIMYAATLEQNASSTRLLLIIAQLLRHNTE